MDAIRESYQSCTLSAEKARKDLTDEAEQAMNDAQNTFNTDSKMLTAVFNKHKAALDKKAMDATNWLKADLRLIDRFRSILKIDYQKRRESAPFTPITFRPSIPAEDEKVSDAAQNAKTNEETEQKEEAVKAQVEEKEAETKALAESKAEAEKEEQKVEEKEAAHEVEQAKDAAKEAQETKAEEAAEVKEAAEKAADDEKKAADDAVEAATVAAVAKKKDPATNTAIGAAKIGSPDDFSWSAPTGASSSSSTGSAPADGDDSSSMTAPTGSNDENSASDSASDSASEDMPASDVVKAIEEPNTETPVLRGNQCRCSDVLSPVCGVDGVSYANACSAKCKKVDIAHKGKC